MSHLCIPQDAVPFSLLPPAADAGGRTSAYKSLRGAEKAWIVVYINQGAANTVLLSPLQGLDVAGTSPIACRACRIWVKLAPTTVDFTKATEATTYTTDAGAVAKIVVFEIDPNKSLTPEHATGVYDCVAISTGASAAGNITSALLWIQPKHCGTGITDVLTD
jgi:hypothetical protein